ncbi:MAG: hypothetical protein HXX11_05890 [Desulfuromonadales bacterium]|nr:hypothetical protein [Desulfuromonadales bacterium]
MNHSRATRLPSLRSLLTAICLVFLLPPSLASAAALRITLSVPGALLAVPAVRMAVEDSRNLLQNSFPGATVNINDSRSDVLLILRPVKPATDASRPASHLPYPTLPQPDSYYGWQSRESRGKTVLTLSATTPQGLACGLYGLLQEKLGIRFIHPRQTIIPRYTRWPLRRTFGFSGRPLFASRGFHLHTLHPTELTEQLHDPNHPNAFADVAAYIDWLARNGQNTFQFFLLRGIERREWICHARRIVEYAHARGIKCGVEISLAMLQQQAFQTITLLRPFPSYHSQVDETLAWLFQAPWDFITLEATMGEYLPLLGRLLPDVQEHFERVVMRRYGARLLYATHVITQERGNAVRRPMLSASGILVHTVMCYSASETKAPVYGNANQRFMLRAARQEAGKRETWYWPESSYWVAFDSPVPLFLLPYLDSRWDDIQTMKSIGVDGHLTFSSGWEWGYWLIDWSIARWSWRFENNGKNISNSPLSTLADLFPDRAGQALWHKALKLQNHYLKERELLRYMSALTTFSELPAKLSLPFQPAPEFSYAWLLREAPQQSARKILRQPISDLETYAARMEHVADALSSRHKQVKMNSSLSRELINALRISTLRARHRAYTLQALLSRKGENGIWGEENGQSEHWLGLARQERVEALRIVRQQENSYRYPLEMLAQQRPSRTAYQFGYLFPVDTLFFWVREEKQIRNNRFDPLFMNLWDYHGILGLESLFMGS